MGIRALLIFLLLLLSEFDSLAGTIAIGGKSSLALHEENQAFILEGSYSFENSGTEPARDAFLSLEFGSWRWVSEPITLAPGEKHSWNMRERIALGELLCPDIPCSANLPRGSLLLFLRRHYQDLNGYRFSAADIVRLETPSLSPAEHSEVSLPPIEAGFEISGNGQEFEGRVKITNQSAQPESVFVNIFTSKELEVLSKPEKLMLAANSSKIAKVHLRNLRGLLGSSYGVYAALEWEQSGLRNSQVVFAPVQISEPSKTMEVLLGIGGVIVLMALWLYIAVFHKRHGKERPV